MRNIIINNGMGSASISFAGEQDGMYLLSIRNRRGKMLYNRALVAEDDTASVKIPTTDIRPGMYSLIIRSAQKVDISKIFLGKAAAKKK